LKGQAISGNRLVSGTIGSGARHKALIKCGFLSSLVYLAMNVFIPMFYPGYSSFSQTVSELSAVDSPTRTLWLVSIILYSVLVFIFGWGVRLTAQGDRRLRIAGSLVMVYVIVGLVWPPMHQREVLAAGGGTLTDTLHIAFTMFTVPLMLLIMGLGAAAFGKHFRRYSMVSILLMILFGILTGLQSARMEANLSTPWMGVWERISIAAYMIWIMVFAVMLLKTAGPIDPSGLNPAR
jgi:hypothetical protein